MLTTVADNLQPQFTATLLTSVDMTTLKERLVQSMGQRFKAADLARECDISRAAVAKWFSEATKKIYAEHVFKLSRLMNVDPEWLATGSGKSDRGTAQTRSDAKEISPANIELIRRYASLKEEVRLPIAMLINAVSAGGSDRHAQWSASIEKFNAKRDAAKRTKPKKTPTE